MLKVPEEKMLLHSLFVCVCVYVHTEFYVYLSTIKYLISVVIE